MEIKTIDSTYSYSFYTDGVNAGKLAVVKEKAKRIKAFKNELAGEIFSNLMFYKDMSKVKMVNYFNCYVDGLVGQDVQNAIVDVWTTYSNKFDQIKKNTIFHVIDIKPIFYKKNGRRLKNGELTFKKGDFKEFKIKEKSTRLTKVMSYFARYGNENTLEYVAREISNMEKQLTTAKEEKVVKKLRDRIAFFKDVLFYCNKFSFERLLRAALLKRKNVFDKYNQEPIEFKSDSFRTTSRIHDDVVSYNKNYNSVVKAFLTIGGFAKDEQKKDFTKTETFKISFPVKYSKAHHGPMKDYLHDDVSYIMCVEKDRLRIILAKDGVRSVPVGGEELMGVDVNIKHNMFAMKDGETIDYDRDILDGYVKFLKYVSKKQARKEKAGLPKKEVSRLSAKIKKQKEAWEVSFETDIKMKCSALVDKAIRDIKNNIILEDLEAIAKSFTKSEQYQDMKYSRLWRLLGLSSLKKIVRSIAYKKGVCVSFVHPHYTSQECKCGNITKENRKTQEEFHCTACGHKQNADSHSADIIELRLSEDVLRDKLLVQNEIGEYSPRKLSKDTIKDVLLSHSYKSETTMERDVIICPNLL